MISNVISYDVPVYSPGGKLLYKNHITETLIVQPSDCSSDFFKPLFLRINSNLEYDPDFKSFKSGIIEKTELKQIEYSNNCINYAETPDKYYNIQSLLNYNFKEVIEYTTYKIDYDSNLGLQIKHVYQNTLYIIDPCNSNSDKSTNLIMRKEDGLIKIDIIERKIIIP